VNAIRIFVHPAFIGLPQLTWNGPESIRYTSFPDSAFVWNRPGGPVDSLDEIIAKLYAYNITPIFQIFPVDEYLQQFNKSDLTFLNKPNNTWGGLPNPLCPMGFDTPIPCGNNMSGYWPKGLPLEDFRDLFDLVSISLYADTQFPPSHPCQDHSVRKTTDSTLKLLRQHILPKKWIWAETGWSSPSSIAIGSGLIVTMDDFHLDRATNLLSTDNLAGFLLWQARDPGRWL
jgi:hypothetical protein